MDILIDIEDALRQIRQRKSLLISLEHSLNVYEQNLENDDSDDSCDISPPELEPFETPLSLPSECLNTTAMTASRKTLNDTRDEFSFTPSISRRSRELAAARRERDPSHSYARKSVNARSAAAVIGLSQASDKTAPANPLTQAIANRIKQVYGSLEEYHRRRREESGRHKMVVSRIERDMNECTFRPHISSVPPSVRSSSTKPVVGMDTFVQRQEKARELKLVTHVLKPGCGELYTGKATKVEPFSFANRRATVRE